MSGQVEHGRTLPFPKGLEGIANNTLVIGDLNRWKAQGRVVPPLEGFQFVDIEELNADIVNEKEPDIILSPLVADDFDAVDVAMKLIELRYQGRYRAIAEDLPDADLIRKEVQTFAPQLDFDLLLMPRLAGE